MKFNMLPIIGTLSVQLIMGNVSAAGIPHEYRMVQYEGGIAQHVKDDTEKLSKLLRKLREKLVQDEHEFNADGLKYISFDLEGIIVDHMKQKYMQDILFGNGEVKRKIRKKFDSNEYNSFAALLDSDLSEEANVTESAITIFGINVDKEQWKSVISSLILANLMKSASNGVQCTDKIYDLFLRLIEVNKGNVMNDELVAMYNDSLLCIDSSYAITAIQKHANIKQDIDDMMMMLWGGGHARYDRDFAKRFLKQLALFDANGDRKVRSFMWTIEDFENAHGIDAKGVFQKFVNDNPGLGLRQSTISGSLSAYIKGLAGSKKVEDAFTSYINPLSYECWKKCEKEYDKKEINEQPKPTLVLNVVLPQNQPSPAKKVKSSDWL